MYIIGNSFKDYCDEKNSVNFSNFVKDKPASLEYRLGQGLTLSEFNFLSSSEKSYSKNLKKVELALTHKQKEKNSLIVNFRQESELEFSSGMYIHGDNDLLMDHITGLHIPGVALVEASRELFIVALSALGYGHHRFVLNSIQADFLGYVFPVDTQLSIRLERLKDTKQEKIFMAHIDILQNEKARTSCTIKATLIPETLAKFSERISAQLTTVGLR